MESIKYIAFYTGLAGVSVALSIYFFRDVIANKLLSRLSAEHSFRILKMISIFTFVIAVLGILTYVFLEYNKNIQPKEPSVTQKFKCPIVEETLEVIKKIDLMPYSSKNIDPDDLLMLQVLKENFLKYHQIDPECDEYQKRAIATEIHQAQKILNKYGK